MNRNIIGISAFYHDSACCIIQNGKLVAAVQEERFSRKKNDPDLPVNAFMYCLDQAGISIADIDCIAYYEDPFKKSERQLWSGSNQISADSIYEIDPNHVIQQIRKELGYDGPIKIYEHHQSHAASAFYFSGFDSAAILTVDGVGEWATTTYGVGKNNKVEIFEEVTFPDSLGLLYSTITSYLGFEVNGGEYKVMGLAPYGEDKYLAQMHELLNMEEDGKYSLNLKYFDFLRGERMYSDELPKLFGIPVREKNTKMLQHHMDIAKSLQCFLEETLIKMANYLYEKTGEENLCMAGGVALNCVANGKVLKNSPFKKLYVQPAANDSGCALGAAALAYTELYPEEKIESLKNVYLGPSYSGKEIENLLGATSLLYEDCRAEGDTLVKAAQKLAEGKVIGWFNGRMEFGPRSLGARSILGDPRVPDMRDRINAMVKKREGFRPFAPAVLEEKMYDHFDIDHPSPFMLETCQVKSTIDMPAITHVDNSARIQSVNDFDNPRFAQLIREFDKITGCPILLNTSFNIKDEPIVCTPEDALVCFITTDIDCLVLGDFIISKEGNEITMLEMINNNFTERGRFELNPNVYTFI
ncbi:carbamoyltransferase family protein [Flavobacterium aestivum]|uniref:carbamoyltransferase family protein n=1 Tax=Flavobacterium aestivum TaxID=3003257 RepID=UPI00248234E1|nr:carbamoyltransferase [Flavobacterium aestivum]